MSDLIEINDYQYRGSSICGPLKIHSKYAGSLVFEEYSPLLYGKVRVVANMTGRPTTVLKFMRYSDDLDSKELFDLPLKSNTNVNLVLDKVFFDSISVDDFYHPEVFVYFSGYELPANIGSMELSVVPLKGTFDHLSDHDFDYFGKVQIPEDFDNDLGNIDIIRKPSGEAVLLSHNRYTYCGELTNANIRKYLDGVNGDDANTGDSWGQAYKTADKLHSVAFDLAYVKSGDYATIASNDLFKDNRKIISVDGRSNICYGLKADRREWTDETGGVWSNVLGVEPNLIIDTQVLNAKGDFLRYTQVNSLLEVQQTPSSFWQDPVTDRIYLRTNDDLTADRGSIMMSLAQMLFPNGNNNYGENLTFIGGIACTNFTANRSFVTLYNCDSYACATGDNFKLRGNLRFYLEGCLSYAGLTDGFDYGDQGDYSSQGFEYNTISRDMGLTRNDGANNGSSAHGNSRVVRVNCIYFNTEGRIIHDVNDSRTWNINVVGYSSLADDFEKRVAFAVGTSDVETETSMMWLDGCSVKNDDTYGAEVLSSHARMFVRNSNISNVKDGSVIEQY